MISSRTDKVLVTEMLKMSTLYRGEHQYIYIVSRVYGIVGYLEEKDSIYIYSHKIMMKFAHFVYDTHSLSHVEGWRVCHSVRERGTHIYIGEHRYSIQSVRYWM